MTNGDGSSDVVVGAYQNDAGGVDADAYVSSAACALLTGRRPSSREPARRRVRLLWSPAREMCEQGRPGRHRGRRYHNGAGGKDAGARTSITAGGNISCRPTRSSRKRRPKDAFWLRRGRPVTPATATPTFSSAPTAKTPCGSAAGWRVRSLAPPRSILSPTGSHGDRTDNNLGTGIRAGDVDGVASAMSSSVRLLGCWAVYRQDCCG